MSRNEAIYLVLAIACGLIFVAATFSHTGEAIAQWQAQQGGGTRAAGKTRPVDRPQIRARTEQGLLSGHEALYYKPYVENLP